MSRLIALLIACLLALPAWAGEPMAPRDGWAVYPTGKTYKQLVAAMKPAIKAESMGLVTQAGPTKAAAKRGMRTLRKRIRMRGREMEQDIDPAYLKRLQRLYDKWIENYTMSDVMVIDSDRLDYASDLIDQLDLIERVEAIV